MRWRSAGTPLTADFVGVQGEVEVERVELLGGPGADGRRTGDGSGSPGSQLIMI